MKGESGSLYFGGYQAGMWKFTLENKAKKAFVLLSILILRERKHVYTYLFITENSAPSFNAL